MHFPDSDPQWKGGDSKQFLAFAAWLVRDKGYEIVNVDSTVILERPKLKDFRLPIREALATTISLHVNCVSVKFKTAERVGPVGEGKSAEAQAIVMIEKRAI
jgi:2-C-methyl-D-erythritol 2,4-cyclodiphosphate synthase